MCQNITQKEDTWFNGLGDLMWNYPTLTCITSTFFKNSISTKPETIAFLNLHSS